MTTKILEETVVKLKPQEIEMFKQDFQPQEYSLVWNYRATKTLLNLK
jgi:hypothetical protein